MNTIHRAFMFLGAVVLIAALLSVSLYGESGADTSNGLTLRVGAGDDITGLFMEDLLAPALDGGLDIEFTAFMDCCGSSAQWAMADSELDAGFYCGGIALALVNKNSDLEIYGPAVMNAELVALGQNAGEIRAVGIPLKRTFLSELVAARFPAVEEISEVSTAALHFALAGGNVDGAVVDAAKAFGAPGFSYLPLSEEDYISYCLVVNKNVVGTERFGRFLSAYNQMAENYNDAAWLAARYEMSGDFWRQYNTRFLKLL